MMSILIGNQRLQNKAKDGIIPIVVESVTRNIANCLEQKITRSILGNLTKRKK